MNEPNYTIRELLPAEKEVLEVFLYEAIFQKDNEPLLPRTIIKNPELSVYIDQFGKKDDWCFVADIGEKIVGAVWVRILTGEVKGFGNIDSETPEFAISILPSYRNCGIGTALMKRMIDYLKEKGYKQTSLSVAKQNAAFKLYKKLGFEIVSEHQDDYLMVLRLNA